jgi:hypothetical protein
MGMYLNEGDFLAMWRKYFLILILLLYAAGAAVTPVTPNEQLYEQQDYLRQISANYAWALSTGNAYTVTIAILDSGVYSSHEDLNVLSGWNFVSNPPDSNSEPDPTSSQISYHGTAVAGIAAAIGNNGKGTAGIAWNAKILPVRVIKDDTTGASTRIADGIRWAVDNGADIINMSLGMPIWKDIEDDPVAEAYLISQIRTKLNIPLMLSDDFIKGLAKSYFDTSVNEAELLAACQYAKDHGVLLVAAMGNTSVSAKLSGYSTITLELPQTITSIPAGFTEVIGVAGVSPDNSIGGGSLTGSGNKTTELAAPYSNMWTTMPGNTYANVSSGTSYATPVVSGVAALVKGTYPYLTASEIREILQKTATQSQYATQVDPYGKDPQYGYGVVNAYEAVRDTTAPVISGIVTDNSVTLSIEFTLTDNAATDYKNIGVDLDSLSVTINGKSLSNNYLTFNGDTVTVAPPQKYPYGATINVEIAAADRHGNTVSVNFSYHTENPPTPKAPDLNWFNADERNTAADQIIEVIRPEIPDELIGSWGLSLNGEIIRADIPAADTICTLNNVTDNQTITVSIFWVDKETGVSSPFSPEASLTLSDRTPPRFVSSAPAAGSDAPSNSVIEITVTDDHSSINDDPVSYDIEVSTDSINSISGNPLFATDIFSFQPDQPFGSNERVFVTLNFADSENNTASVTFDFYIEIDAPAVPLIEWLNENERNTTDNQQIVVSRNQTTTPPGLKEWKIYFSIAGHEDSITVNMIDEAYIFDNIPDNTAVTVQITWVSDRTESAKSPAATLDIGNRTPPQILSHTPADGATQVPVNSDVLVTVTNNNSGTSEVTMNISTDNINTLDGTQDITTDSSGNLVYKFTPDNHFEHNEHIFVTFKVTDNAGNTAGITFNFKTELPQPDAPTLTWDNENERNTADNQKITVSLDQPTPNEIKEWCIYFENESFVTVDINENSYTIGNVPDNMTITLQISWVSDEGEESALSPPSAELVIGDRTPPHVTKSIPESQASDVPSNFAIAITLEDEGEGINTNKYTLEVSTDNVNDVSANGTKMYMGNIFYFIPSSNIFNYNDQVFVTFNFADQAGNTASVTLSFRIELPQPSYPGLLWENQASYNTTQNQRIVVSRDLSVSADYGITHWKIYNAHECLATVDIGEEHYVLTGISDNININLQTAWYSASAGTESNRSPDTSFQIADRTPPLRLDPPYPISLIEVTQNVTPSFGISFEDLPSGLTDNLLSMEVKTQFLKVSDNGQTTFDTPMSLNGAVTINYKDFGAGYRYYVLFEPDDVKDIGTKVSVTINVFDNAGNNTIVTESWLTNAELPMPDAPRMEWLSSPNYNTTDNQTVRIHLPPTTNTNGLIQEWNIKYYLITTNSYSPDRQYQEITSISITSPHIDIYPVSDNLTINASVYWLLPSSDIMTQSPEASLRLGDRTPPIVSSNPVDTSTNVPVLSYIYLYFKDHSEILSSNVELAVTINDQAISGSYFDYFQQSKNSYYDEPGEYYGRLTLGQPLNYDNTVTISVRAKDLAGNSSVYSFSFSTQTDNIPPTITSINIDNRTAITTQILDFHINDSLSGINPDTLRVSVNAHSLDVHHYGSQIIVRPSPDPLYYGEEIFVTINVADYSGNQAVCTFSYTTELPPTPSAPIIDSKNAWINIVSRNTTDNQQVKISRPATINNYLEKWELNVSGNGEIIYIALYSIASENVEITVSDNQLIQAMVRWYDTDTGAYSPSSLWSPQQPLLIDDRTPPTLNWSTLTPQPGSTNVSVTADIFFQLTDPEGHFSSLYLLINNQQVTPTTDGTGNYYIYKNNFNYSDTVRVTLDAYDQQTNYLSVTYSFETVRDDLKPQITINSPLNGEVDLDSPLTLSFTVTDFDSGISLNSREILLNGATVNYQTGTITNIAGGQKIDLHLNVSFNYEHHLTINVADKVGNMQTATINFKTRRTAFHILENDSYYGSILAAVSNAQPGWTLEINPGEYDEIDIPLTKNITISGSGNVTLNAKSKGRHFSISNAQVTLNRINLINGSAERGGSITLENSSGLKIYNAVISGNHASINGGAIYRNNYSDLELHHVQAYSNSSGQGAFAAVVGNNSNSIVIAIKDSIFARNHGAGLFYFSNTGSTLQASRTDFVYNNNQTSSTSLFYGGNIMLENCVVYQNIASNNAPNIHYPHNSQDYNAGFTAKNSILWGNTTPMFAASKATLTYSNTQAGNFADDGTNSSIMPSFVSTANEDFRLTSADLGIDRGTDNVSFTTGMIYEHLDIGSHEYAGLFIDSISPAPGSKGNLTSPEFSFVVRNEETGGFTSLNDLDDIILTVNITGNTVYHKDDFSLSLQNDNTIQAELALGNIGASQTVNFQIAVKTASSSYTTRPGEFYTRQAAFHSLSLNATTTSVRVNYELPLSVWALDDNGDPVVGQVISFNISSGNSGGATFEPVTVSSGAGGLAHVKLKSGSSENVVLQIQAWSAGISSNILSVTVNPALRIVKNPSLNIEYSSIGAAFADPQLADGHRIEVSSNYAQAEPDQKEPVLSWPSKNNLTLKADGITINSRIDIKHSGLTATIDGLIFVSLNTPLYIENSNGTVNIVNSTFSDNTGRAVYASTAYLRIEDSVFNNNKNTDIGGALYYNGNGAGKVNIQRSHFSNNSSSSSGGALYLNNNALQTVHISRSSFDKNMANSGSFLYLNASNAKLLIENSLIVNNEATALRLYAFNSATLNFSTLTGNTTVFQLANQKTVSLLNSIVWGNTTMINSGTLYGINTLAQSTLNGIDNHNADPQLDAAYHLSTTDSPAFNKASANYALATDYAGSVRPLLGGYDIGALELNPGNAVAFVSSNKNNYNSLQDALDAAANNDTIIALAPEITLTAPLRWPSKNITLQGLSKENKIKGNRNAAMIVSSGNGDIQLENLIIVSFNNVIMQDNTVLNSITLNNLVIQDNRAANTNEGAMPNGAVVYTAKAARVTLLNSLVSRNSAVGNGGLFYLNAPGQDLLLQIRDTLIDDSLGSDGGVAYNVTAILERVTINNMRASGNGGAFANSTVSADWTVFSNGWGSGFGGVFYICRMVTADHSLFKDNQTGYSGGVFDNRNTAYPININHSIFHNNKGGSSESNASVGYNIISSQISNSVFWKNGSAAVADFNSDSKVSINYSASDKSLSNGTNLLISDPGFIDPAANNYHVTYNSPLIDSGTFNALSSPDYIYDGPDIGIYEYDGIYLNEYSPTAGAQNVSINRPVTFRVRDHLQNIDPSAVSVSINGVLYTQPTAHITTSQNTSLSDQTDFYLTFTPSPSFRFYTTINVGIAVASVRPAYQFRTEIPKDIYVSAGSGDDANDGSFEFPFRTINKALSIAGHDSEIFLLGGTYPETIVFNGNSNISLIGTTNTVISGNISIIKDGITVNLQNFIYNAGVIYNNHGFLYIDRLYSSNTANYFVQNRYANTQIQNSVLSNKTTAVIDNDYGSTTKIIHSNLVNNNQLFSAVNGIGEIGNSILRNSPLGHGSITAHNNLVDIDPLFTDNTFTEIAFNSPAVDAADSSAPWTVSHDIRGLARPEHYRPDIGAWESDKPNIILQQPVSADFGNLLITNNFRITIIEKPEKISTAQISLSLPMDNIQFTITQNTDTLQDIGYDLEALPSFSYFDTGATYNLIITAENNSGNSVQLAITLNTISAPQDIYVDTGSSEYEFGFANYPFRSIQNALDYAVRKKLPDVTINLVNAEYALTTENKLLNNSAATLNIVIRAEQGATLNAQQNSRIFNFGKGYNITLQNLTLVNGQTSSGGGGILNSAVLTISDTTLQNNKNIASMYNGGAILNNGLLTVERSVFRNNSSVGYSQNSGGGAIFNNGRVTVNNTIFRENMVSNGGAGGAINNNGTLYGAGLTISGNSAQNGGSIYAVNSTTYLERSLFRGNTAITNGGAIHINTNSQSNLVNNIFDYNQAQYGGAVAYTSLLDNNIYQSSFIRNTASSGGAIFNNNIPANIYNSLFLENTVNNNPQHIGGNNISKLYNCYPANINSAGSPNVLTAIDKYDYVPNPTAVEIVDNPASSLDKDTWISSADYKNKSRNEPYDIGALEYRPSILIARENGYFAETADGSTNEFTADSTVTIYREIDGQRLGAITIPSGNQIDYEHDDFRSLNITANYIDTSLQALHGKTYWLEMYSPDKYPFISANGKVLSDYHGNVTDNSYLTGNAVISANADGSYTLTVKAIQTGRFELVHPATLNLTPALAVKNFDGTSTLNIAVRDKYGSLLSEVPVTLSTDSTGSFGDSLANPASTANPASATGSIIFKHPPQEELSAIITGNFADLTATISARTIDDQTAPTISFIAPALPDSAVTVTQNIIFAVADPESEIATFSFILNGIDHTAELLASENNVYIYNGRLALNTPYSITLNATNNVDLATVNVFAFQTKNDTDPPTILAYPAPGQTKVPQDAPLSFNIEDLESGLSLNTLTLEVSGNPLTPADYILTSNSVYSAQLIYTPPAPFELASTISVTLNIEDNLGNSRELAYTFVVISDFRPPTINALTITRDAANTDSVTLNISVTDDNSELDLDSISISINGQTVTPQILSLTTGNKQLTAELLLTDLGYNQALQLVLYIADVCGNTANSTVNFTTAPDLLAPVIQPVEPTGNSLVNVGVPLIIEFIDTMSGIDPHYIVLQINDNQLPYTSLQSSLTVSSDGKSYRLAYQPPEPLEYDTEYRVTVTARDRNDYNGSNGNLSVCTYSFQTIVDTIPPTAPDIAPLGYTDTSRALIRITGNKEVKSELLIYVNGALELLNTTDYLRTTFDLTLDFQNRQASSIDIQIIARDKAGNISPTSNSVTFNYADFYQEYNPSASVLAPAGTFNDETAVTLSDVTKTGYYAEPNNTLWISSVWELVFNGMPNKGIEITIPLEPAAVSYNNLAVYYFNAIAGKWELFADNAAQLTVNGTVNFATNKAGMYTLGAALNKNATVVENYNVIIAPNPVKLSDGPLHFVYRVPNNCSAELRIYTISGRLLYKTTKDLAATSDFPAEFIWSGENNFNDQIGNGAYIVLLTLADQVTGEKHVIKSKFAVLN